MYNPEDKDLDRISRNAAENYQAPGRPAWDALQKTLEKELPQEKEKKRRGFLFFFLFAGLFVAGSLYWYAGKQTTPAGIATNKKIEAITKNKNNNQVERNAIGTKADSDKKNKIFDNKDITTTANVSSKKHSVLRKDHLLLPIPEKTNNGPVKSKNTTGNNKYHPEKTFNRNINREAAAKKITPFNKDQQPALAVDFNTKKALDIAKKNKKAGSGKIKTIRINKEDHSKDVAVTSETESRISNNDISGNRTIAIDSSANANINQKIDAATNPIPNKDTVTGKKEMAKATGKKKKEQKNEKGFSAALTAGMDLSTVKYTHSDNPGFNFGLLGGYRFSKNWSVYTGLIYTKKNYNLNGTDYHPPMHYWTTYVDLQTVEGYCRMWEVPLLARYTFNSKTDKRFFVSTGVSSYFMKKQQYNYSYKVIGTGTLANSAWTNDSSFNHIFSILHISAGFEKRLGKNLSWQIEPYAKIPLTGVGFGNIKLSSFGLNFSILYRHPVRQ
jgi:hypothetical protein